MKKLKLLALTALSALTGLSATSCSSWFGEDSSAFAIESYYQYVNSETGELTFVIAFNDGSTTRVIIPTGVGISEVTHEESEDGESIVLTIYYTDSSVTPTTIEIPISKDGEDGRGIEEIQVVSDEENRQTTITFSYTDSTEDTVVTIPWGSDGTGIESIVCEENPETGDVIMTITTTDGNVQTFTIASPQDGTQISGVTMSVGVNPDTGEDSYIITITMSDGGEYNLYMAIPANGEQGQRGTKWYAASGQPGAYPTDMIEGDYYLDTSNGAVYIYNGTNWDYTFSLDFSDSSITACTVYFYANAPEGGTVTIIDPSGNGINNVSPLGNYYRLTTTTGSTIPLASFPTVTCPGYDFAGWYTTSDASNPNSGHFTDLTPIPNQTSLNLFARWETSTSSSEETTSEETSAEEAASEAA